MRIEKILCIYCYNNQSQMIGLYNKQSFGKEVKRYSHKSANNKSFNNCTKLCFERKTQV